MTPTEKAWSGDLREVTWFFFRSPNYGFYFQFGRKEGSKYWTFVLKLIYWGFHVAYTSC